MSRKITVTLTESQAIALQSAAQVIVMHGPSRGGATKRDISHLNGGIAAIEKARSTKRVSKVSRTRECPGHPAGPSDPMGVTIYCDGSCR